MAEVCTHTGKTREQEQIILLFKKKKKEREMTFGVGSVRKITFVLLIRLHFSPSLSHFLCYQLTISFCLTNQIMPQSSMMMSQ